MGSRPEYGFDPFFFKKWKEELEPSPKLSSWLYRVTHNCAVDYLRKETRHRNLHSNFAEEKEHFVLPNRGEAFRVSEEAARAVKALHTLSIRDMWGDEVARIVLDRKETSRVFYSGPDRVLEMGVGMLEKMIEEMERHIFEQMREPWREEKFPVPF